MTEHLARSESGRTWVPDFGPRAEQHWGDGASAIEMVRRIAAGEADSYSGRIIHAGDDLTRPARS